MNTITNREIRVFVAGAMAFYGFEALTWLPSHLSYFFAYPMDGIIFKITTVIMSAMRTLSLPLGLGIFFGKEWGVRWTKIFLMAGVVLGFLSLLAMCTVSMNRPWDMMASIASDLITNIVLLWLLSSSRFQEGAGEQGSTASSSSHPSRV